MINPSQLVDFKRTSLLRLVLLFIFLIGTVELFAQQIPRAGFPYCQPFLGTQDVNSIPFTVADGEGTFNSNPFIPYQTGQGLRLTESGVNLRGWIFVDLPFSPTYGIKTSFEYFIHNQGTSSGLGDGFSFFLFDGKIDKTTFEIGGLGGSLGYAPHGNNVSGTYTSGGLKGGYMGIGFDVLGNYGNYQEKKFGGFHDPNQFNFTSTAAFRRAYPDAITIRSPQDPLDLLRNNGAPAADTNNPPFKSYQFVTGKILYYDPSFIYPLPVNYMNFRVNTAGSGLIYSTPSEKLKYMLDDSEMFKLTEGLAPSNFSCNTRPQGYRKVFIDLKPNVGNPLIPYTITIDLLIDNEPTTRRIVDNQPYAYPIPPGTEFLKLGFSASTGTDFYSAIDIRNVAALVSSVDDLKKPTPPELFKEICVEDNSAVELPFCVTLADQNTFIQCIQLFDDFSPADNDFQDDFYQCEQPGFCNQRCVDGRKELQIFDGNGGLIGTLKADLSEEVEVGKYNQANITFERNPSSTWVGTIRKYYKIVDNFGLESDAIPVTITINPKPKLISFGVPLDPTCSGQNDGSLTGIQIGDLVPDPGKYSIEFYDESGTTINAVLVSEQVNSNGLITATFDLKNLNLGKIFVKATNPSSTALGPVCDNNSNQISDPCVLVDELVYDFNQERGTPVIIVDPVAKICENTPVSFTPDVDQVYKNNVSAPPVFLWYTDENKVNKINPALNSIVVNGNTISTGDIQINSSGVLSFQSLPAGQYEFFVEVDDTNFPTGGNFCINIGELTKVELSVIPAITIQAASTPDWCLDNSGTITINTQGGSGNKTVKLFRSGSLTLVDTKIGPGDTFTFTGIIAGDYQVEVSTQNPSCSQIFSPIKVDGPTTPLTLTSGPSINAFCNGPNGSLQFTLTGGNPVYSITLNGNPLTGATVTGSNYTVTNLAAGSYTVSVTDSRGCVKNTTIVINGDPLSQYGTVSDEICEGETAQVSPTIINQSSSTPSYKWYYRDGTGAYVQINNGNTINGISFVIDASNNLLVTGLAPQATPYTYYLEVTGPKVCAQGYIPAQILVNPKPIISEPVITQVTCNGLLDGSIRAQLGVGNLADFEFNLIGNNGFNSGYLKNSGIFTGLAAGTYELFVKSEKGCISSKSNLVVTEPSSLVINQVAKVDATCDEDNGSFQFTVSGGTQLAAGGYTLEINGAPISSLGTSITSNSPTDFTISKLAPGSYILKATDKNNCIVTLTFTIADTPIPEFDVQDDLICEGESSVLIPEIVSNSIGAVPVFAWSYEDPAKPGTFITINSGDKVGNLTYTISNGQLTVAGLTAQTAPYVYYLSVSGNLVCPASPIPAEIKVVKNPEATFEIENVSCFGGSDGAIKLLTSNPTTDLTYTLSGTGQTNSTGIFLGLKAGSYTVTVKNLSGCEISVPLEVTEPTAPIQINKPDLLRSSCDLENGSIENLVISGGWGDYIVTWKKGSLTGTTIPGTATEVKNLGPGTYFLIIKDKEECEVSFSFVIEESSDPEYAVVPPINVCLGQPVSIRPVHLAPNPSLPPAAPTEVQWYTGPGKTGLISNGADASTPSISYTIDDTDWLNPELKITGLPAGVHDFYFYVVCTGKESKIEVTVYDVPKVELELTPITCFGNTNGKVKISSGALPVYTYSVNGGSPLSQAAFEALNFGAGIYDLEVSTPAGCAQKTTFEILGPSAALSSSPMSKVDPGCNAPNGKLEFTLSGGWLPYTLDVIKNGTSLGTQTTSNSVIVLDGFTSGVYQVKVTDARGCTITTNTVTLVDGPSQIAVDDVEICVGGTAVLTPVIDPLAPGAIFSWFLDAGLTQKINSSATPAADGRIYVIDSSTGALSVTNLPARVSPYVYYVTATGPGVCPGFVERVEVKVYDQPTVIPTLNVCTGDPVVIKGIYPMSNPSYPSETISEVQWYTGPGKAGLISNGSDPLLPSVTYTIEDTDWLNPELKITGLPAGVHDFYFYVVCTGKESKIEVTVYDVPKVELELTPITCFGNTNGKVKISSGALPVYTYSVNGGSPLSQAAFEALNLGAGVYNLEVNTPAGCTQKTTFEILGPSAALSSTPMSKVDPGCNAPNGKLEFTLSGGWLPYTLDVIKNGTSLGTLTTSNGAVVLNGYSSGVYQVKVTDARGCSITTNTVTLVDGPTQIAVENVEICIGGTAILTPTLDPTAPGALFDWYLDAGLTQKITSSATPAADGRIYLINTSTGALSIANLPSRVAPYVYFVTASGSGVCPGFVERVEVKVFDQPTLTSQVKNEVCFGDGGEITVLASGGSGNFTYSLNGGAFVNSNVFKVPVGNYQVEVRTKEGCSVLLNGVVVSGPSASLVANNLQQDSPTCGQSNGIVRFQISGGYSPYEVKWVKNGTSTGVQNVPNAGEVQITNLGIGNYSFEVRDNAGCLVTLPGNFTLVEVPTEISITDDVICEGEVAELIPTLPQNIINPTYTWSFDAGGTNLINNGMTVDGATFNLTPTGELSITGLKGATNPYKYYVTASGNGICNISPKEVKVKVYSIPSLRVSNPSVVCDPKGTVDLTDYIEGFNPSLYDYNVLSPSGVSMQINELATVSLSGDYRVSSAIKGSGCWNQPLRIRVLIANELLAAEFNYEVDLGNGTLLPNAEVQIQENVQFYDFSQGKAIIWNWDFGDGNTSTSQNPSHQYLEKGTYTASLQVIDSIGCISTYERVIVVTDDYRIMVPNAFTPDGSKNQNFKPYTRGIASMEFYVFNTWGELLYKTESLEDQGWNGFHNGKPAPNGNYVYRGKFTSRSGEVTERSGVFLLIR